MGLDGDGYGDGYGYGYGYGSGDGYGYGSGSGDGSGYGYGDGYGDGDGYGSGDGSGYGYGYGSGSGDGSGYGYGYGYGYGDGDGEEAMHEYLRLLPHGAAKICFALPNAELRRLAIEALGPDRFFADLKATVVHEDTDGAGNPRRLIRVPAPDAKLGYLQAVQVVCPTTMRQYYLGVPPSVTTCQDAVAATFGLSGTQYHPVRES